MNMTLEQKIKAKEQEKAEEKKMEEMEKQKEKALKKIHDDKKELHDKAVKNSAVHNRNSVASANEKKLEYNK